MKAGHVQATLRRGDGSVVRRVKIPDGVPFIFCLHTNCYYDRESRSLYVERDMLARSAGNGELKLSLDQRLRIAGYAFPRLRKPTGRKVKVYSHLTHEITTEVDVTDVALSLLKARGLETTLEAEDPREQTVCPGWGGPCPVKAVPHATMTCPSTISRRGGDLWRCRACTLRKNARGSRDCEVCGRGCSSSGAASARRLGRPPRCRLHARVKQAIIEPGKCGGCGKPMDRKTTREARAAGRSLLCRKHKPGATPDLRPCEVCGKQVTRTTASRSAKAGRALRCRSHRHVVPKSPTAQEKKPMNGESR